MEEDDEIKVLFDLYSDKSGEQPTISIDVLAIKMEELFGIVIDTKGLKQELSGDTVTFPQFKSFLKN